MVQGGVPPAGAGDPDGLADGLGRPDEHNKQFRAGDGGVEQVRCSIIHELVVIGMTTHGYSLPWARCTVTA